jgi:hypothetical protein
LRQPTRGAYIAQRRQERATAIFGAEGDGEGCRARAAYPRKGVADGAYRIQLGGMVLIHYVEELEDTPRCGRPERREWIWSADPTRVTCLACMGDAQMPVAPASEEVSDLLGRTALV